MTQCEYCETHLWNPGQTDCSGGACSSAYEMAQEEGIEFDEDEEETEDNCEDN